VNIVDLKKSLDFREEGQEIYTLMAGLYPICRSITGNGYRETMEALRRYIPVEIHEIPSGTKVFDWTVPKEWNIRDAYVKNSKGEKIIDFQNSNLHVLNYSTPIKGVFPLKELKPHLFTLPDRPEWIPYRTSYYEENWGFCLSHNQLQRLEDGQYEVFIDSTLEKGSLTYGEIYLKGEKEEEILISCHACHPSLANDNLSGVSLTTLLAKHLGTISHRFSYRFLFIPGTIGAICWLSRNEPSVNRIKHGLVITGVGDSGEFTYKKSRRGDAEIDRVACQVLKHSGQAYNIIDFEPYGYDERQYCSPGFDLPVGRLSRTPHGRYPEYHTSGDNLDFVQPQCLEDSFRIVLGILEVLEENCVYLNLNPKCEPQLGRRGLYNSIGVDAMAMLWVMNLSDGLHTLLDIGERSGMSFEIISTAGHKLYEHGLVEKI